VTAEKERTEFRVDPENYRDNLKRLAMRMADDFMHDITLEINVDRTNKITKIKVTVHRF
jgi:hypothetical protein